MVVGGLQVYIRPVSEHGDNAWAPDELGCRLCEATLRCGFVERRSEL